MLYWRSLYSSTIKWIVAYEINISPHSIVFSIFIWFSLWDGKTYDAKHDIVFKITALQFSKDVPFPAFQTHGVSKVVPSKERRALHTDIAVGLYIMGQIIYNVFRYSMYLMVDNNTYQILTLNIYIYYNICITTDVITSCTLIVPCLVPVYVL